jgi:hypothetical protein
VLRPAPDQSDAGRVSPPPRNAARERADEPYHEDMNHAGALDEPAHGVLSPSGDCDSAVSLPGLEESQALEASSKAIERSNRRPESV